MKRFSLYSLTNILNVVVKLRKIRFDAMQSNLGFDEIKSNKINKKVSQICEISHQKMRTEIN